MKISARNTFKGKILSINPGAVNAEVTIELSPGIVITSVITLASAQRLGLKEGGAAYAVIKASDVMIGVDEE